MTNSPENRSASTPDAPMPPGPPGAVPPAGSVPPESVPPAGAGESRTFADDLVPVPAGGEAPVPAGGEAPVPGTAGESRERLRLGPTRTSAMWFGVWAGVVMVILLIIFVAQNTAKVQINFLWMSGQISLALAMLIAGVAGAIIAMGVSAARIIQLRRMVRRGR